ncbi:MAG: energy-coupling factor transporter transmembrane component T [Anaerolineaceae bacterium]|nr:energy-coupling factor transporter transmembrane component T [Anaerolineaceae bacterium]
MDAELYIDNNSFIHRLDPRTKIIVFLLSFVAILLFQNPIWMLPVAFLIFLEMYISKSFKNLYRIRVLLIILSTFSLILWNVFSKGTTHWFLFIYKESFFYSIARTLLMVLMISAGVVLISTTRNEELVLGLIKLGVPYRVGFAISTALRLVPTIASSTVTISQAQRSRGLDLDSGSIVDRIRKFLPLLVPVFISTIRNTNIFAMALESKGFGAREDRTYFLRLKMQKADYIVLIVAVLFVLASIVLSIMGYGKLTGLKNF